MHPHPHPPPPTHTHTVVLVKHPGLWCVLTLGKTMLDEKPLLKSGMV